MRHILSIFALIAVAATVSAGELPAASDSIRALVDQRSIVGVVPVAEGVDVYWQHTNELATPYRPRLMWTPVATNGSLRGPIRIVREDEMMTSASVAASAAGAIALWRGGPAGLDALFASKIVDGVLKNPEGKLVTTAGQAVGVQCSTSHCFALWNTAGVVLYAAELDALGNVTGPPILLRYAQWILSLADSGIFMIGTDYVQQRATVIDYNGTIEYDTPVSFEAAGGYGTRIAVDYDGTQHVIASVEVPVTLDRPFRTAINATTISDTGQTSRARTILDVGGYASGVDWVQIGWNGTTHLVAARVVSLPSGAPKLLTCVFDRDLNQVGQPVLSDDISLPQGVMAVPTGWVVWGNSFRSGSPNPHPTVVLVSSEGVRLHATQIDDAQVERRRATRR